MTSTEAIPIEVYELLADHAKQLVDDPLFRVELEWTATGTIIVVIYSEKGGVGKTALTTGLAAVAAARGLNVVVIDLDPRATTTEELGIVKPEYSVNDILYVDPDDDDPPDIRGAAGDYMVPAGPDWPGTIRVLASERSLGNREFDNTDGMTDRLAASLDGALDGVDLVLMDVPPRPGGKLVAAAAKVKPARALVPALLDPDGWIGATDALTTLRKTRRAAGMEAMQIIGVLRHIVDRRRSQIASIYDDKMRTKDPIAPLLLGDVAVPRYAIRVESRELKVPITVAGSLEARAVIGAYTRVLNHIAKAG